MVNNFVRGQDPKESIGLGYREVFKSMEGCLLLTEQDLYQFTNNQYYDLETVQTQNIKKRSQFIFSALVIIIVIGDRFKIMKNRLANDYEIYPISELPKTVFRLKELYDIWMKERNQL